VASVDVPIVRPNTEAAPKDYEIPAAQEIAPLAVRALVDGSGAGSAFVPALQLISPGGQVMWTAPTSETVAAGASADVSWFPRVGRSGASSTDTSSRVLVQGSQAFPAGSSEADIFPGTVASFVTSDATAFTVDALTGCIQVNRDGLYDFWLRLLVSHPAVPTWTDLAFLRMQDPARTFQVNAIDGSGFGSMGVNHAETTVYLDDHFTANLYNYEADTGRIFPFNLEVRFGTTYDLTPQSASYAVVGYRYEPLPTTWYN
jgi:hypothetical protein